MAICTRKTSQYKCWSIPTFYLKKRKVNVCVIKIKFIIASLQQLIQLRVTFFCLKASLCLLLLLKGAESNVGSQTEWEMLEGLILHAGVPATAPKEAPNGLVACLWVSYNIPCAKVKSINELPAYIISTSV